VPAGDAEADEADVLYMPSIQSILKDNCLTALINSLGKKGRTLVIAPQVVLDHRRGARVRGAHQAASHIPALNLPSRSRYSFTDHLRMEG